jgi:fatty acid desaturase
MLGLRYSADLRTLLWEVIYFSVTVYLWSSYDSLGWISFLILWWTSTMFAFFGATITHNAIHVPLFRDATLNSIFQIVLTLTYGWPVSALVPGHNLSHHKFTNGPKDLMRPQKMRYSWNLLNYLVFPIATVRAISKYDVAYMRDQAKKNRPIYKQYIRECLVFYPLQVLLAWLNWRKYVAVILIPQLYAKWQIIAMNILQHDGCPTPEEDVYNHARNFVGTLDNFFTFNNGYHTIHHMNPGMHWTRLPQEHQRTVVPRIHPNLCQRSIIGYILWAHIYPGERRWFDGSPYKEQPDVPDQPWYDGTAETYSG